jgi:hypothetical protein
VILWYPGLVSPHAFFVFWFLEFVKEIDGVDELFFRDLVLILFPLLLNL